MDSDRQCLNDDLMVAPRAGAWIETLLTSAASYRSLASPPVRGRGLKRRPSQPL